MEHKWYAIISRTNFENKAKQLLEENIKKKGMEEYFSEILVPEKEVPYITKSGKRAIKKSKIYPGYIYLKMEWTKATHQLVIKTTHISNFVGGGTPNSIPESEMNKIAAKKEINFQDEINLEVGDTVRVDEGPFSTFTGTVDSIISNQKIKVNIMIFGRPTPTEIDPKQVTLMK